METYRIGFVSLIKEKQNEEYKMWYKKAQDFQDISDSSSPSTLGSNSGITVTPSVEKQIQQAVQSHTPIQFTTTSGQTFIQIHGTANAEGEFCGEIEPGKSLCGQELLDYLQKEKGFAPSQIIACGAGNLQGSSGFAPAFTETGVVEIGFPDTNNLDPNAPVQLPITRA